MNHIPMIFAALAVVALALGSLSVWSVRRLFPKVAAVACTALFLPLGHVALGELLSRPKPVALEHLKAEEATVVSSMTDEAKGIYLWLQVPGSIEPRSYVLPWSRELAEELQEAKENNEGQLKMRLPFEPSLDDRGPRFYAAPQPSLPPKDLRERQQALDVDEYAADI